MANPTGMREVRPRCRSQCGDFVGEIERILTEEDYRVLSVQRRVRGDFDLCAALGGD